MFWRGKYLADQNLRSGNRNDFVSTPIGPLIEKLISGPGTVIQIAQLTRIYDPVDISFAHKQLTSKPKRKHSTALYYFFAIDMKTNTHNLQQFHQLCYVLSSSGRAIQNLHIASEQLHLSHPHFLPETEK